MQHTHAYVHITPSTWTRKTGVQPAVVNPGALPAPRYLLKMSDVEGTGRPAYSPGALHFHNGRRQR
jgi:hypothetical protein